MQERSALERRVIILGRSGWIDAEAAVEAALRDGVTLVLLTLGYPVTDRQDRIARGVLERAAASGLPCEAAIVTAPAQAARFAGSAAEVSIEASRREQRQLQRAGILTRMETEPERPDRSDSVKRSSPEQIAEPHAVSDDVPVSEDRQVWTWADAEARKRAPLRIYLGGAPGVGKTFAMLSEGRRRKERGTDVVVGVVHTYDRPGTVEMLEGFEVVPPRALSYRGRTFEEMDVEALIARRPDVALIDELAHTNVPGSRRTKRWEYVFDVLAEGIEVITTVNTQHIESLNDVVADITGIEQQETLPDWVVDIADQVELIDMSPHALRRRMAHGNVYPDPTKAELALQRYFTVENLAALRELALMRVADHVDADLLQRWNKEAIPETRERILVCVARRAAAERLIRRGARMSQRSRGDLLVVHVTAEEHRPDERWLTEVSELTAEMGGTFEVIRATDTVDAVLSFAHRNKITQVVVGESVRSRWSEILHGSFVSRLIRRSSRIDVHVIAEERPRPGT